MANYPALFRNANGRPENLLPADGGLEIDVVDCTLASSTVSLFSTVDNTGSLALFTAYDSTCTIGTAGSVFTFAGGVVVTQTLGVTGAVTFDGAVTLGNAANDDITITGSVASDIAFENAVARAITLDGQPLTIGTTTAGALLLVGAAEIDLATIEVDINATGGAQIDAVTASQFVVSGAAADLTLGARAITITLNEVGDTDLDTNFTATSIVGAVNEVKTANLGTTTPNYQASDVISVGDVVYLNWDVGNGRCGVYLADNTVAGKQDPVGVALTGGIVGTAIYIATHGQEVIVNTLIVANNEGAPAYLSTAGAITLVPPVGAGNSSQIIGQVSAAGVAGAAKIIVQLRDPGIL